MTKYHYKIDCPLIPAVYFMPVSVTTEDYSMFRDSVWISTLPLKYKCI